MSNAKKLLKSFGTLALVCLFLTSCVFVIRLAFQYLPAWSGLALVAVVALGVAWGYIHEMQNGSRSGPGPDFR